MSKSTSAPVLSSAPSLSEIDEYLAAGGDPAPALTILRNRSLNGKPSGERAKAALVRLQAGKSAAPWADMKAERAQKAPAKPAPTPKVNPVDAAVLKNHPESTLAAVIREGESDLQALNARQRRTIARLNARSTEMTVAEAVARLRRDKLPVSRPLAALAKGDMAKYATYVRKANA